MSNKSTIPDAESNDLERLLKEWRRLNITSRRREFSVLSQRLFDQLMDETVLDNDVSKLITEATALLTTIWPFYPIIASSEVANYRRVSAHLRGWERTMEQGQQPREGTRRMLSASLSRAAEEPLPEAENVVGLAPPTRPQEVAATHPPSSTEGVTPGQIAKGVTEDAAEVSLMLNQNRGETQGLSTTHPRRLIAEWLQTPPRSAETTGREGALADVKVPRSGNQQMMPGNNMETQAPKAEPIQTTSTRHVPMARVAQLGAQEVELKEVELAVGGADHKGIMPR